MPKPKPALLKPNPALPRVSTPPLPAPKNWPWNSVEEESDDFIFFMAFVESIAPDCRKYSKRFRADELHDERHSPGQAPEPADTPLYRVFDALLDVVDTLAQEPMIAARMRARLPQLKKSAKRLKQRRKAMRQAHKAQKTLDALAAKRRAL